MILIINYYNNIKNKDFFLKKNTVINTNEKSAQFDNLKLTPDGSTLI